jgi:acyl-CoA thioesterase-2
MNSVLQDLIELLDLEQLEVNLFRGQSRDTGGRSVFGGQVISQALVAANRTVPLDRPTHSLHAYFLRPGDMEKPIVYEVDRVRDGRSFTTRRVQAIQRGEVILSMIASYQVVEKGFEHQAPMPDVPAPESLTDLNELARQWLAEAGPIPERAREWLERKVGVEFRPVDTQNPITRGPGEPVQRLWMRAVGPLPDDPALHRHVLAYASDFNLIGTAQYPHGVSFTNPKLFIASIDHALWFHRDFRIDDWLLYDMDSPSAQGSRGFARGQIFDRKGRLVASVAQEGLMRWLGKLPLEGNPG